jgi:hypothetical protein
MGIWTILLNLMALGSFICFIVVLIKLFQTEGALHGILGLICSPYTFIWGWINASKRDLRSIMLVWTILWLLAIVFKVSGGQLAGSIWDS